MDTEIKQKHLFLKKYGAVAAGGILIAAIAIWAIISSGTTSYSTDRAGMTFGEVTKGEFNDYIRINGRVESGIVVQVSALETGIVEKKWVEEGEMVKEGDIILTLHNPTLRQQILDSESQLAERQNMLRDTELAMEKERLQIKQDILQARTELNRKERAANQQGKLYKENLTSREEYLKAQEDLQLARENLELLRSRQRQDSLYRKVQLEMMRESLDNMRENFVLVRQRADNLNIRASHSGQLGSLSAELGQNIAAGQQVGQINILDNYKISAFIDEHYIDRVAAGLSGEVVRQGFHTQVSVSKVYPEVSEGKFRADLVIDGPLPDKIRVGQSYPVDLMLGSPEEAVIVPRGSFFQTSGGKWAYVVSADGKTASKRDIRIGRQNPQYYEVISGLEPGERIITSSYSTFGNADKLKIK